MKKFYFRFVLAYLAIIAVVSGLLVSLPGCASITGAVAPQVASAVNKYCLEPFAERSLIRTQVNGMIAPATIKVTCPGDPAP